MKNMMVEIKHFARKKGVWLDNGWTPGAVITMWSTIWHDLEPYLRTVSKGKNGILNYEKSRRGQLAWRTFYNKLYKSGTTSLPSKCEAIMAGSPEGAEHDC